MTTIRFRPTWIPALAVVLATWPAAVATAQQEAPEPPPLSRDRDASVDQEAPEPPPLSRDQDARAAEERPPDEPAGHSPYVRPQAIHPQARRSVVHHYPYPYPGAYHGDETGGFRNPGGVGRYAEYYPPGNRFQEENDPVKVAKFAQGGGAPDRQEQLAAYNAGTARYNAIQRHIDRYGRGMYGGFGFGMGGFGGFW